MRHAGGLRDAPVFIQRIVASISIGLQDTAVPCKVLLRMEALGSGEYANHTAGCIVSIPLNLTIHF